MLDSYLNPYRGRRGHWLRGNFHGHCSEHSGCSSVPLLDGVRRYTDVGADFMAVTDHDIVTDLAAARAASPGMIFLRGFEYSSRENLLFIGEDVPPLYRQTLEDAMRQAGALLTIVCHPQPQPGRPYWSFDMVAALPRKPDGIEVHNGHYGVPRMRERGQSPDYRHVWDEFLTAGMPIWGFANDDFHDPADFNNAFNMVLAADRSAQAILAAARGGCFYGSTGLTGVRVTEEDGALVVATDDPCVGRFVGAGGKILAESLGSRFAFAPSGEAYVRFEAESGRGRLFLQPLLRRDAFPAAGQLV